MELREHALWVVECMTTAGFATPMAASPRRRPPSFGLASSFGLTPNPEKILEEANAKPLVSTCRAQRG